VVEAIALLYQRQRQILDGHVVATVADIETAIRLTAGMIGAQGGLERHAQDLLTVVTSGSLATFTMADVVALRPDWTRWTFRAALQELIDLGYLTSPPAGRGTARVFQRTARSATSQTTAIHLRPEAAPALQITEVGGLAAVGGIGFTNVTNGVA
jgi:hypothetical protein